jgi:hypothetical protein
MHMQSEFQKQQKANKIDWPLVTLVILMTPVVIYLAAKAIH